jgi:translation initiation factor IF-3
LIDQKGDMQGVVTVREAISQAQDLGLDLIEISPNAEPPVCKIGDFGKYMYELQKKAAAARKNQKVVELKEVQLRPTTDKHDYDFKLRNAKRFIEEGNKVKFCVQFKGREMEHKELGFDMIKRVKDDMSLDAKIETDAKMEGRQIILIMGPIPKEK